jgi:hypothetical protein
LSGCFREDPCDRGQKVGALVSETGRAPLTRSKEEPMRLTDTEQEGMWTEF